MSKLISCKACSKQIAKGVKKCPDCGKDQRNWLMRHKILSFLAGIILISIISASIGGGDTTTTTTDGEQTVKAKSKTEETIYKTGDTFKQGEQLEISVTDFEEMDSIGDPDLFGKKASEGGTLAAIQYTLKNISNEPVGMFDYPSVNLMDENGTKYDADVDASASYATETGIDDSKILSDLNPDITVTATSAFEISKEQFAKGKWYIQIGKAKVQIK